MNLEADLQHSDLINKKAAIFKNLLISKFRLADKIGSKVIFSKATCGDLVENRSLIDELMRECPDAKVKYSLKKIRARTLRTKRFKEMLIEKNRAAKKFNSSSFSIKDWMKWLLFNKMFIRVFYVLVIWNMISVVLDIEYGKSFGGEKARWTVSAEGVRWNLAAAQTTLGVMLIIELIMKWILDFIGYWKKFWNYVDFFVVIITTPFLGTFFGWYELNFGETLVQACRTLVALKLIHELNAMKAVFELLALTVASMVYVVGFIVILTYLCGLIATTLFDTNEIPGNSPSTSTKELNDTRVWEPAYAFSFGLGKSIIAIFRLFTLDGWYKFYKSFIEVHEVYSSSIFIFSWVFLSAFLLGNLFPALLITNFQRLRGQLKEELEHAEIIRQMSKEIVELGDQIQEAKVPLHKKLSDETTGSDDGVVLKATSFSDTNIHTADVSHSHIHRLFTYPKTPLQKSMRRSLSEIRLPSNDFSTSSKRHEKETINDFQFPRKLGSLLHMFPQEEEAGKAVWHFQAKTPKSRTNSERSLFTKEKRNSTPVSRYTLAVDQAEKTEDTKLSSPVQMTRQGRHVHMLLNLVSGTDAILSEILKKRRTPTSDKPIKASTGIDMIKSGANWLAKINQAMLESKLYEKTMDRKHSHVSRSKARLQRDSSTTRKVDPRKNASNLPTPKSSKVSQKSGASGLENLMRGMTSRQLSPSEKRSTAKVVQQNPNLIVRGKISAGAERRDAQPDVKETWDSAHSMDHFLKTTPSATRKGDKTPSPNKRASFKFTVSEDKNNSARENGPSGSSEKYKIRNIGLNRQKSRSSRDRVISRRSKIKMADKKPSKTSMGKSIDHLVSPDKSVKVEQTPRNTLTPPALITPLYGSQTSFKPTNSTSSGNTPSLLNRTHSAQRSSTYKTNKPSTHSKVSRLWGRDRLLSSSSATASTKINSVLQVLRVLSPFAVKNRLRRIENEADINDVEINVIEATPRSSVNRNSPQASPSSYRRNFDSLGQPIRRQALSTTSKEEIDVKTVANAVYSGLGVLMRPGVQSKLNLLELQMGMHGRSLKVLRANLGQRAKFEGEGSEPTLKFLFNKKNSVSSLGRAFIRRKHHSEPVIQRQWLMQEVRQVLLEHEHRTNKWQETVKNCYPALKNLEIETEWSEIILLNYLHTLTALMENLKEREILITLLNQSLVSATDDMRNDKAVKISGGKQGWSLMDMVKSKVKVLDPQKRSGIERDVISESKATDVHSTTDISIGLMHRMRHKPIGAERNDSFDNMMFGPKKDSEDAFSSY